MLAPGTPFGPYEVLGTLGAGGMGEVYRARDTRLKRDVALKILPESFASDAERLARFQREAEVLAALNHPNIAAIYGFEEANGTRALVIELVEGETLADRIARGPIPVDEAFAIARQIADALEAAHERGIIHRDLKPANIKLRPDGTVKVLDFGLAKALGPTATAGVDATASPTITSPAMMTGVGMLLGTAAYMSPEQARGKAVDKRSDIWAFGCVLYEMLAGRRAFDQENVSDTITAVLRDEPDWSALPAVTPVDVRKVLRRCLEKDGRKRWQAAGDLRIEIEATIAGPRGVGMHVEAMENRKGRRGTAAIALSAALAGAAFTSAIVWMLPGSPPAPAISRFAFTPPGQFTGVNRQVVSVSPDGANIVYVANNQLYLRRMNDLEARPIIGSNQRGTAISSPFFSPDNQWIGFWATDDSSLKKIPLTGGAAVKLCEANNPFGVSWEGDRIVFGQDGVGLLACPEGGGTPEVWVKTVPGETAHNPQLLPGGAAVLFSVTRDTGNARWDSADIAVVRRSGGERKILVRGGSAARYVSSGHIVYAVGGDLLAVPFDLESLEMRGSPVPVVQGVMRQAGTVSAGAAHFDVSQTGTLVYVQGIAQAPEARALVWVDRQGREQVVNIPPGGLEDPRLSPDGGRIVMNIGGPENDIWTFELTRGALMRQTFEAGEDETPMWSPDGAWIAYGSTRGDQRFVFRRRVDGIGAEEPLWSARIPTHSHVEDWTSDGRALLIATGATTAAQFDLIAVPVEGDRTPKPLLTTRFDEKGGRISPDGRWMAYSSNESGRDEVYVQPFPTLDRKWQVSTEGGSQPVWSRRGDELFFRGGRSLMVVRIETRASFSPGSPQRMFDDQAFVRLMAHTGYDVSMDARRFLFVKNAVADQAAATPQVVVVYNWFEELKRLVPTN